MSNINELSGCPMPGCNEPCVVHDYGHNDHDNIQWSVDCAVCDYCAGPYPTKEKAIDAHRQVCAALEFGNRIYELCEEDWDQELIIDAVTAYTAERAKGISEGER